MDRRICVVINPAAGGNFSSGNIRAIERFLELNNLSHELHFSEVGNGIWPVVAKSLRDFHTDLVIVGGDGTINEAINGMMETGCNPEITIIPLGSGNDFVKNLPLGKKLNDCLDNLIGGQIMKVDLGKCNERYFTNGVGLGFDGQIAHAMIHRRPLIGGHIGYYYHVLRILASFREREVRFSIDEEVFTRKLLLLTVANGTTFGGGFMLTPEASVNDSFFDVCAIGEISALRRFLNVQKLKKGHHGQLSEVNFYKSNHIEVEGNEMVAHIDGEYFGHPPFKFQVLPKHLKVRVQAS